MLIDLRSDTVTRPSSAMREAMMNAPVGDDVFGEDPTMNSLQEKAAALFGKEAALFVPSGTMGNQIAINVHTRPGDEVICPALAHIYLYEGGGVASNSGCSMRLLDGDRGRLSAAEVAGNVNNTADAHLPRTSLVSVEDTCNKGGGSICNHQELIRIGEVCRQHDLRFHCDGARLFNALVETGVSPVDYAAPFDSLSICLSKGLGAPVGSVLVGSASFIREAHRRRKRFGGGMRQAGILAAAGIYALDHHVERLKDDHRRARQLGDVMSRQPFVAEVMPVDTNIVIFLLREGLNAREVVQKLREKEILCIPFGPDRIRFVTHLHIEDTMVGEIENRCAELAI